MKTKEKVAIYFILGILLFAVFNLYNQGVPYDNNAAGFILAGFSVLVAVLVGWQIYSSISIEYRTKRIEKRLEQQMQQLLRERKNILGTSKMSKEYCQGISCLSIAMIQYYETLRRRLNNVQRNKDKREEELKEFVSAYLMSARAIVHLINTKLEEDFPIDLAEMSVQGLELTHKTIFHSYYLALWPVAFSQKEHEQCDKYYKAILDGASVVGAELLARISSVRNRRDAFRKELANR